VTARRGKLAKLLTFKEGERIAEEIAAPFASELSLSAAYETLHRVATEISGSNPALQRRITELAHHFSCAVHEAHARRERGDQ
jgi:hypothetical protein